MTYRKALRPRTIIPDNLYVDRDADRQLNDVIDDMGRPGYILVARQMGKTNLLLRMKRRREADGELAVYVDLSIGFSDARGLFHHLIDSLLESLPLDDVREKINLDRLGSTVDPSVEYDRHLRLVLSASKKERVIIILDEIDSLVGQPYSDRILSQVRSMYFARANFAIYESLTYVLSGVAEPTDLIKDKNISPFNIGEKIYLSDFSRSEVSSLLRKAGIEFDLEIQEAVYGWTSGNPRMTWDVYSALEDAMAAAEQVDLATVDAVIERLYLTRFDRAPLDHIRALAENEPEVRAALVALLYGKGETLDDRSKSKLYLAGITTASANHAPTIKNRVIEHALSETWLAQVEAGQKGLLTAAGRRYSSGEYRASIDLFNQYIGSGGAIESLEDFELLQYGMALYNLGLFQEAIGILDLASTKTRSNEVRTMLSYHKGLAIMLLGKPEDAIEILQPIAEAAGNYMLKARHAVGTAYLHISMIDNADLILKINEDVLNDIQVDHELTPEVKSEIITAVYYNIGQVYSALNRTAEARSAFNSAHNAAVTAFKPAFASVRLRAAENDEERAAILAETSEIVVRDRIPYATVRGTLGFDESDMAELMAVSLALGDLATFDRLLDVAQSRAGTNPFETIVNLANVGDRKTATGSIKALLKKALTTPSITREALFKQKLSAASALLALSADSDQELAFETYWALVSQPEAMEFLNANDTVSLANQVGTDLNNGNLSRAKQIMLFVRKNEKRLAEGSSTMFAFFVYQEMIIHRTEQNYTKSLHAAREVLSLVSPESVKNDAAAIRNSALVERLRQAATRHIGNHSIPGPRIGRNEFVIVSDVATGSITRVKFKKVADRIASGELEIVTDRDSLISR
ncbi:AAA-like domain-containing protein [Novosphingobium sp. ST904]|uniref:AAA-like domain-containing protein n=1 Tax=Novosphingobium sp. ST904 TaxID=1684385 RepID=UPI0010DC60F8|nr:AAA-like domain-containing protein [Novosphingobium sp. ST904]TCM28147.1 AAA domain-containing protein [Novosphingobium sp. ST904]